MESELKFCSGASRMAMKLREEVAISSGMTWKTSAGSKQLSSDL